MKNLLHNKRDLLLSIILLLFVSIPSLYSCTRQGRVWIPGWRETTPFDHPRVGAATVVVKGIIYVIGGVDGKKFLDTTIYARIGPDGSIGPWKEGPRLNEPRGFAGVSVKGDLIYVVGGGNGPYGKNLLNTVERARIRPEGGLDPWIKEKQRMIIPRRCAKIAIYKETMYSFGGFGGTLLDNVEYARINKDGSVGEWHLSTISMMMPRYINGIKKWKDMVYIIGGHDEKGRGIPDVEWSEFSKRVDRELTWKATAPLKVGRYGLGVAIHKGNIYGLGGLSGTEYLDTIEISRIQPDGGLFPWNIITTRLPRPAAFSSVVIYRDWIYLLGGTNVDGYFPDVYYATFNDNGEIGFWGSKSEAMRYKKRIEERKKTVLPNEGVVQKVIQASSYTYIQVKNEKGLLWLAAPSIDVKPNNHIRYSKGVYMSNFYSKELDRAFPSILFVSRIDYR